MSVALNYAEEGSGAPVVLLHPVGLDRTCWSAVAARLARRRRVIAVDLRGHGESPAAPRSTDIFDYAEDVADLIRQLAIVPCPVVGVSFGGMAATALAIAHPDVVSTAVISACPSAVPEAGRDLLRARGDLAIERGMEAIVAETLERWFSEEFRRSPAVEPFRQRLLADRPETWRDGWHTIAGLNLTARLADIRVPVRCIHAAKDRGTSLEAMTDTAEGVPDGTLDVIEGAPHMVHIEHADRFAELVLGHLDRIG